ncbi:MAG: DUF1572 family protein [Acidobacteriota bacterium]|nr:DUF1572 family protein [Acidobacteriota bacterium]
MRVVIESIEAEYQRYKKLAELAFGQLSEEQLAHATGDSQNSVATLAWHVGGNLKSRFTEFLDTDGEKPWRERETEFRPRHVTHAQLLAFWEQGWLALSTALRTLTDSDLTRTVVIRNQQLSVVNALHRSLAHTSYHVGQIIFLAKTLRSSEWQYLSIPPGNSAEYNQNPTLERTPRQS